MTPLAVRLTPGVARDPIPHVVHEFGDGHVLGIVFTEPAGEQIEFPGVLAYGATEDEAIAHVQALALRVVADRPENDEAGREFLEISFNAA